MTVAAGVGYSADADVRTAGRNAAAQAWERLGQAVDASGGRPAAAMGLLIGRCSAELVESAEGAAEELGGLPLWGFSSTQRLTSEGRFKRGVALALLGGDLRGRAVWRGDFAANSRASIKSVLDELHPDAKAGDLILAAADGVNGDGYLLPDGLAQTGVTFAGCLSVGEAWRGRTYQLGGRSVGSGGLSAAVISGNFMVGQAAANGFQAVGFRARVTRADSVWLRHLDGKPAGELYNRLFGVPGRSWAHPPLNELVRLYPLGMRDQSGWTVRSVMRIEADGSLRMHTPVAEGKVVDILVGSPEGCLLAAEDAARRALAMLGSAKPRLVLVLVDAAWASLLELDSCLEAKAIGSVIGSEIPLLGGYTFGQFHSADRDSSSGLLNGHILVTLLGDAP